MLLKENKTKAVDRLSLEADVGKSSQEEEDSQKEVNKEEKGEGTCILFPRITCWLSFCSVC